jgi:aspartyl-tRNA(Asn)/glutamyl-tRNA(Gln) amidotransferase subunit A
VTEWHKVSATDLGGALRAREISPVDLVDDVLRQVERVNPRINALIALDEKGAREAAKASEKRFLAGTPLGLLDGMPLSIKDNLFVKGVAATWGSELYKDFVPTSDELPVARLRTRGGVILGKTNVPAFTLQGFTSNQIFGTTHNPWDTRLTPGGSSGGAVAAVACGLGALALGTDGGGSIRRPAGYTNLVGLKPSPGRIARGGGFRQILYDLEVIGLVARTVADVWLLYRELAGPDSRDRRSLAFGGSPATRDSPKSRARKRVLLVLRCGDSPVDPEIVDSVTESARRLERLGYRVEEADAPFPIDATNHILDILFTTGLASVLREKEAAPELDEALTRMFEQGIRVSGPDYLTALNRLWHLRNQTDDMFDDYDLLMTPTSAAMPWSSSQLYPRHIAGKEVGPRGHAVFTGFANVLGIPGISVPGPRSPAGIPIGFQLVGRFGDEESLLATARDYESAWPWANDWPSIACSGLAPAVN